MRRLASIVRPLLVPALSLLFPAVACPADEPYLEYEFSIDIRATSQDREKGILFAPSAAPLTGEFLLSGTHDRPLPIRVVTLLDYRQVFPPGSGNIGPPTDLSVPVGQTLTMPFVIPHESDGQHLLLVLVFFFPGQHMPDADFRRDSRFFVSHAAARVRWGTDERPSPAIGACQDADGKSTAGGDGLTSFSLQSAAATADPWFHASSEETGFVAGFNNPSQELRSYVLMAFRDFTQVEVSGAERVACRRLAPLTGTRITGGLPKVSAGTHEFLTVLVADPFSQSDAWDPEVESSQRVLLNEGQDYPRH